MGHCIIICHISTLCRRISLGQVQRDTRVLVPFAGKGPSSASPGGYPGQGSGSLPHLQDLLLWKTWNDPTSHSIQQSFAKILQSYRFDGGSLRNLWVAVCFQSFTQTATSWMSTTHVNGHAGAYSKQDLMQDQEKIHALTCWETLRTRKIDNGNSFQQLFATFSRMPRPNGASTTYQRCHIIDPRYAK